MTALTPAQQLWFALGLPHAMPRHKNGGPMNGGWGPTHKGWNLHKLAARNERRGTYRKRLGLLDYPCNGWKP